MDIAELEASNARFRNELVELMVEYRKIANRAEWLEKQVIKELEAEREALQTMCEKLSGAFRYHINQTRPIEDSESVLSEYLRLVTSLK